MDIYNTARVDIKNYGGGVEVDDIYNDCNIEYPEWFNDDNGPGIVITSKNGLLNLKLKCIKEGVLKISFRGIDLRIFDNTRRPVFIRYKYCKINGSYIFDNSVFACHDIPYIFNKNVIDQEVINIEIEWETINNINDLYKNRGNDYDYLQRKNEILEMRVLSLERELDYIKNIGIARINRNIYQIVSRYKNNIWELKDTIQKLPNSEEQKNHIIAYDLILKEYGSWIGWNSKFSGIPCLPHGFYGIFISGGAKIGKNVVIFQHVTIGSNTLQDSKTSGFPTIGDNCYIGAGAKIIGNISIGDNCRIGANAVVFTDVPDNSVVVMEKPRIIHKENMDNKFYHVLNGKFGYHLDGKFYPIEK